jgi:hypothetical protein
MLPSGHTKAAASKGQRLHTCSSCSELSSSEPSALPRVDTIQPGSTQLRDGVQQRLTAVMGIECQLEIMSSAEMQHQGGLGA